MIFPHPLSFSSQQQKPEPTKDTMDIDNDHQDYGDFSRKAFLDLLEGMESPGSIAAFGHFDRVYPDIAIDGRSIRVPLRPHQALEVIKLARQAPFGRGAETIVDRSVRNTWERDPTQFQITNPAWEDAIHKACSFVAKELGITAPITAELYKMLIYEEGAMFKPHTEYPARRPSSTPTH